MTNPYIESMRDSSPDPQLTGQSHYVVLERWTQWPTGLEAWEEAEDTRVVVKDHTDTEEMQRALAAIKMLSETSAYDFDSKETRVTIVTTQQIRTVLADPE